MDKIYSRKRLRIPFFSKKDDKTRKKFLKTLFIIIIAFGTVYNLLRTFTPIFEDLCAERASSLAVDIITTNANSVLGKYNYQDIVEIIETDDAKILKTNVVVINSIATEITNKITISLKELEKSKIEIPVGALTGIKFLTGTGPNINIKIMPAGTIDSEIKTEFQDQGINQTVYRVILILNCDIKIVMPYGSLNKQIRNQILLVDTAIVGDVPETYYNLDNMTKEEMLRLID